MLFELSFKVPLGLSDIHVDLSTRAAMYFVYDVCLFLNGGL